jgi:hypothetical protein
MKTINFGKFREQFLEGHFNVVINSFNQAFDLSLLKYIVLKEGKSHGIRDYHEIDGLGQKLLLSLKKELNAFHEDYYKYKTTKDIAIKINESPEFVFDFIQKRCFDNSGIQYSSVDIKYLNDENKFNTLSKVNKLSSFQIMKDIQLKRRFKHLIED